jgi:hypothetical protein
MDSMVPLASGFHQTFVQEAGAYPRWWRGSARPAPRLVMNGTATADASGEARMTTDYRKLAQVIAQTKRKLGLQK